MKTGNLILLSVIIIGGFAVWYFFFRDTVNESNNNYIEIVRYQVIATSTGDKTLYAVRYYSQKFNRINQTVPYTHDVGTLDTLLSTRHITNEQFNNAHIQLLKKNLSL